MAHVDSACDFTFVASSKIETISFHGVGLTAQAQLQVFGIGPSNNIDIDLDEDEWSATPPETGAKGKVDEVTVTPNVKPKLRDHSRKVAVNKGGDKKRSREQKLKSGPGKSRPPFQLKIKPRSK